MGLFGVISSVASTPFRMATSGPLGRATLGMGIGAAYGGLTSESFSTEGKLSDMLKGAAAGGLGGALSIPILKGGGKAALGAIKRLPSIAKAAWGGAKMAGKTARFATRYPGVVGGLGVAGGLGYLALGGPSTPMMGDPRISGMMSSPTGLGGGSEYGVMPNYSTVGMRRRSTELLDSTYGLVQGLHAGRNR